MILIVLPSHYPFVIATCLEFAMKEIAQGRKVAIVNLSWLDSKFINNRKRKFLTNYTYRPGIDNVIKKWCKKNKVALLKYKVSDFIDEVSVLRTDRILREYFIKTLRSTHAKRFGTIEFDIAEFPQEELDDNLKGFLLVQLIMHNLVERFSEISNFQIVTVNGRFNIDASVIMYCKTNGIKYIVLESGLNGWNKYLEFESSIQSISELRILMNGAWQKDVLSGKINGKDLAIEHMNNRLGKGWRWSTSGNADAFNKSNLGNYAVFFPTSNWEFGIFDQEVFEQSQQVSQAEAFRWFAEYCNRHSLKPVVRVHPHPDSLVLAELEDQIWEKRLERFKGILIKSNDDVNSHKLAENATVNVVHQSSIGAELLWSGRPTVITGETLYSDLVPEFVVKTEFEFKSNMKSLFVLDNPERLYPWAYFMEFGGNDFIHFKVLGSSIIYYDNTKFISENFLIPKLIKIWKFLQKSKIVKPLSLKHLPFSKLLK